MKVESTGGPAPAAAVYQEDTSHRAQVAPGPARGSTPAWWRHFTTFQQLLRQRMAEDRLSQQAAALTYNTLFSLLPTLVLALIVMSMVLSTGQVQREEIVLLHKLGLGQLRNRQGGAGSAGLFLQTVTAQIQKMRTVLQSPGTGLVGFAVLLWGALSLMNVVEATFNRVYRVTRRRTWVRRLPLYWCVLTLGPLGVASSLVFSGKLLATIGHRAGPILAPLTFLLALGIDWILLMLFYRLIPNAYVRWRSAALGAAAATLLWEAGKYGFGLYVHYLAGYGKWYGNLGLIPLFMFWVFLTWMFVLLGLQIAFIDQHYMALQRRHLSPHGLGAGWIDIRWVLPLAVLLVRRFQTGATLDAAAAAHELGLPPEVSETMLNCLASAGLVHTLGPANNHYVLARPPERISTLELLQTTGACGLRPSNSAQTAPAEAPLGGGALGEFQALEQQWAGAHTLADLAGPAAATVSEHGSKGEGWKSEVGS